MENDQGTGGNWRIVFLYCRSRGETVIEDFSHLLELHTQCSPWSLMDPSLSLVTLFPKIHKITFERFVIFVKTISCPLVAIVIYFLSVPLLSSRESLDPSYLYLRNAPLFLIRSSISWPLELPPSARLAFHSNVQTLNLHYLTFNSLPVMFWFAGLEVYNPAVWMFVHKWEEQN